jgi:DNA-binding MarR family transcriptional regulator/N-acetylglutamate synthase-like GNAT family acetyltransferase
MSRHLSSAATPPPDTDARVDAMRRFNRFYTKLIGALPDAHLDSPYSLVEVRVLYELAHRTDPTASTLARALDLDPGQLSRTLRELERQRLVQRRSSPDDARRSLVSLTAAGRRAFTDLNRRAHDHVHALLSRLRPGEQRDLLDAMATIERLLAGDARRPPTIVLREPRAGDFGWVVARHGALYAEEYGWDQRFEALVARIVADLAARAGTEDERGWIAEADGLNVGCVFLARRSARVAQLRLLLVEPGARGLGVGTRLVDECVGFARRAGYRTLRLWTNSVLADARRLYERTGFRKVAEKRHESFGQTLVGQTWELPLRTD